MGGRRWRDSLMSFILALRTPHLRKSLLPHLRQQGRFLTPAAQTPGLALHSFTVNLPVASQHHQALLSGFCSRKVAPPPPMWGLKALQGKRDATEKTENSREKGEWSQGHSKTIIPPARWSVRPPSHCWCRKGAYLKGLWWAVAWPEANLLRRQKENSAQLFFLLSEHKIHSTNSQNALPNFKISKILDKHC